MKPRGLIVALLMVVGLVFVARPVVAAKTGSDLLNECLRVEKYNSVGAGSLTQEEYADLVSCLSFVAGVQQGLIIGLVHAWGEDKVSLEDRIGCFPHNSTPGQYARVVIKFLNEHPERLHERASFLVVDALIEAFPCK